MLIRILIVIGWIAGVVFIPWLVGKVWNKVMYGRWNEEDSINSWTAGCCTIIIGGFLLGIVSLTLYYVFLYITKG